VADPDAHLAYRKMIEGELNRRFGSIINGSAAAKAASDFFRNEMKTKLSSRPDILGKIMPTNFGVGCRRPAPANCYLEVLAGGKTTVYTGQIERITPRGFINPEGDEQEVDVVNCATVLIQFMSRHKVLVNGSDVRESDGQILFHYISASLLPRCPTTSPSSEISTLAPTTHSSPWWTNIRTILQRSSQRCRLRTSGSIQPKSRVSAHFLRNAKPFL
jgi:hypothetical protein